MAIDLGNRLRQVISGAVPRVTTDPVPPVPGRGQGIEAQVRGAIDGRHFADVLAGNWVESCEGAVLIVDRYYSADRLHGRVRVGDVVERIESGINQLQVLGRAWPGRDPRPYTSRLCFFDLETTGLAGGAGTQAFLVGCGLLEDGGIRVRQFLLPGFEHERALLSMLAAWIGAQGTLVTFNGRSFDVPLIETRYLLHRLSFPFAEMPHLDMLHPARRLWKQRPTIAGPALDDESCRLSVLERHLAGYHRVGDVPGFEIPSRYYRFVRTGDAHGLEAVLEHNRIDLISLALVTARALTLIARGPNAAEHPREALGLGRLYERSGASDDAEASFLVAAALAARVGREPDVRGEALRRLALCRRRAGRMAEAAAAWEELLTVPGCPTVFRREAREALAIHHEHRSRDLRTARTLVLDVLAENAGARAREAAEYRLQRIERKIAVREQGGLMAALESSDPPV
jgi:uncharacterized protein YprB with RNaseH-like and TPR domain